jgi:hypothetical protein
VPRRFDQGLPGLFVAIAGDAQAALGLEVAERGAGGRAKKTRLGAGGGEPGGTEAAL